MVITKQLIATIKQWMMTVSKCLSQKWRWNFTDCTGIYYIPYLFCSSCLTVILYYIYSYYITLEVPCYF